MGSAFLAGGQGTEQAVTALHMGESRSLAFRMLPSQVFGGPGP